MTMVPTPITTIQAVAHTPLTRQQREILAIIVNTHPDEISIGSITDQLYANDPAGGPEDGSHIVSVQLRAIRKAIRPLGWTIPALAGRSWVRRGIRLERVAQK